MIADRIERTASIALSAAAVIVAVTFAHREFAPTRPRRTQPPPPAYVSNWRDARSLGHTVGDTSATVSVVEFGDLECPFCRAFHSRLKSVEAQFGTQISFTYVHYPLSIHRFAIPAMRAAECAAESGRFGQFLDAVYAKQDSLGLRSWLAYAVDAGVSDTATFVKCTTTLDVSSTVDASKALGRRFGVTATPTILINGWRFFVPPEESTLVRVIGGFARGGEPFGHND